MPPSIYASVFARASEVMGGLAQLCEYLQVPQAEVMRWIRDEQPPPTDKFQDIIDLLLEYDMGRFHPKRSDAPKPE